VIRLGRDVVINVFQQAGMQSADVQLDYGGPVVALRVHEDRGGFQPSPAQLLHREEALAALSERARRPGGALSTAARRRGLALCLQVPREVAYRIASA
jgi:hypothetical protein